ncbi:MAG: apolipoprotein N-acyltransferase [Fimbriimonadaceae bacterium]|nr:apolipoprotein N-acyltransferase [Fimbriimonadaceae bacterium]QYK55699.1 MAG: apolipoprotein N-acyltransferase [Fimbriimonadaceae bacterium]
MKIPLWLSRVWPVVASVALFNLAYPPFNLFLLVFVALAPWFASLREASGKQAVRSGMLFGGLHFACQMAWLLPFVTRWTGNVFLAMVPWVLASLAASVVYVPLGWLVSVCWKLRRPWAIPLVWAAHEGLRAFLPGLAFPWGFLATPLGLYPQFVQHAAYGTVILVSAWVAIPNVVLAMFVWPETGPEGEKLPPGQTTFRMGLVFLGLMLVSMARFGQRQPTTTKVVTIGQTGVDMAFSDRETRPQRIAEAGRLIASRAIAQAPDLLIYPEGFADAGPTMPPLNPLGRRPPVPVLFAGIRPRGGKFYSTAFGYDGEWRAMDKTRLVVFGEYVPGRGIFPFLDAFNLAPVDLSPGSTIAPFEVNGIKLGPLICFEGVFTEVVEAHSRNGAQLLAQMSIDDWYEETPAWNQLWLSTVWRSIESGLPVVRCGSRGRSLVTDQRGVVRDVVPTGQMAAHRVEVGLPPASDAFPYRTGFIWFSMLVAAGFAVEFAVRGRKGQL